MEIKRITQVTDELVASLEILMSQLTGREEIISHDSIVELVDSKNSFLFVVEDNLGKVMGSLTLIIYTIPTRKKGFIEDVVVDNHAQGLGLGRKLMEHAIDVARKEGVSRLELSSRPARVAANSLYQNLGFVVRETNYYQLALTD